MSPVEAFLRFRPMARKIALGFMRKIPRNVLTDDLLAAADMGLWQALKGWAGLDHNNFEFYAMVRIRGAIKDELRREDWLPRRARQKDNPPAIVYDHDDLINNLSTPFFEPDFFAKELQQIAVRILSERELSILDLLLDGKKQVEMAEILHVSAPRVSQLVARIQSKMRAAVERAA